MGDPYSAELMRKRRIVNYCPVYVSAEFNKLNLSYSVSSVKLSVLVDIVYESPSMELANCCNTTKIIPCSKNTTRINNKIKLEVVFPQLGGESGKLYSFLMLDITDELADSVTKNVRVQWQIINIRDGTLDSGLETVQYVAPDPMSKTTSHTFLFLLLRQSGPIDSTALASADSSVPCKPTPSRCNFNLTKFIVTLNLVIEGASWFSSSLDEDYELKMANDGVMRTMEKVCADVACTPTDPDMPDTTSMPANCPTSYATDNRPSAIMLMVVFAFLRWLM
ncbi:uncharacterized protein LOC112558948 [Pomacea canaliculata]|uniref:uncharacterized protein LOC112558948 n=1 Tax=Pomacea canaliculata TaxID=400727 RepID=UPI000D728AD1|nr:uncharacterized protein LOC112558948 [Pomacea canaliculata]